MSATAVLNTLARIFSMPLGETLSSVTEAYRALFYPMIDATIGRCLDFIDIKIGEFAKDFVIVYTAGFSAFFRSLRNSEIGSWPFARFGISIFWPIIGLVLAIIAPHSLVTPVKYDYRDMPFWKDATEAREYFGFFFNFLKEVIFVSLIVVVSIALNASGVLD